MKNKITIACMAIGLAAMAYAQTPTPAPLNVPLASSVNATTTTTVTQAVNEVRIDFILIMPDAGKMVVKIQPLNEEITIEGNNYKEFSDAFRTALAAKLKTHIDAHIAAKGN